MGKFGVGVIAVLFFGWIGSLFGDTGMVIGVILGIMTGFAHDPEEAKKKATEEKETKARKLKEQKINPSKSPHTQNKTEDDAIYVGVVTELMAACITADATIEESEIELATSFIESDDVIHNKKVALDKLKVNVDDFYKEREKSKAVFKLKMTSVTHKAKEIVSDLQKERILVILDGMLDSIKDGNRKESEEFVEKIRQIMSVSSVSDSKQTAAEQYILNSGNTEAINSLREMQKNPNSYTEKFKQASKGNSVMRTALGVFTGVIAANLVTSAIHQYQLNEALSNFDAELESMGGIDNLSMDQDNSLHCAGLDATADEMPYSEDIISDDVQLADAGDIEVDDIDVDDDMDFDGDDDFDLFS